MSSLPPLDELRENLRDAARREMEPRARRSRRRRNVAVAVAIAVLGAAAVAGAAELISTGDPVPDEPERRQEHRPSDRPAIAVTAPDEAAGLSWGVAVYEGRGGEACALAGQVRGSALGVVRDGVFRPYASGTVGACGDLESIPYFNDVRSFDVAGGRSLVFGRAREGTERMELRHEGRRYEAAVGEGGAFLFVFDEPLGAFELAPAD
jgi:hypothetical protein